MAHRLLEAPTEAIAHMIKGHTVDWLQSVKETRASGWFETYWTRAHGNYTNVSAGYVGNNKSTDCQSHWKYMLRDTITLGVMEAFVRVTPMATKVGEMAFLCVCADAYQSYTCVEAIVMSMLFNPDLTVQDHLRQKQLKDRERAILATHHGRIRFHVSGRPVMVLTCMQAQRASSQQLKLVTVDGKRPRGGGRGGAASQPVTKRPCAETKENIIFGISENFRIF